MRVCGSRPDLHLGKPWLFELVEEDGTRTKSNLGFSRMWISTSFGIELGLPASIFAHEVSFGDPVLDTPPLSDETEISEDEDEDEDAMEIILSPETAKGSLNNRSNPIQLNPLPKKDPDVINKQKGYWEDLSGWGIQSFKPISKGKERAIRVAL